MDRETRIKMITEYDVNIFIIDNLKKNIINPLL